MFDEPDESGGQRFYPKDVVGHLLIVWAIDYIAHSPTQYSRPDKPSDVVVVDCVDLDQVDPETNQIGLVSRRTWWRQAQLIASLKKKVGTGVPLLARMAKGVATKGMPPFVLTSMTADPQCVQRANAWFQANPGFMPSDPMPVRPDEPDVGEDASFHPDMLQPELKYGPPPGHQESLRQETTLEAMARRAAMPPAAPPQPEEPPF
jgi:hypothetical protein